MFQVSQGTSTAIYNSLPPYRGQPDLALRMRTGPLAAPPRPPSSAGRASMLTLKTPVLLLYHHHHPLPLMRWKVRLVNSLQIWKNNLLFFFSEDNKLSMAGGVACFSGIYRTKASLTDFIITLGGVVQEGLVRCDTPVKCTSVLVFERTDGPKVALARHQEAAASFPAFPFAI